MKRSVVDGSGAISFIEFVKLMFTFTNEDPDPSDELKNAFEVFDHDDS